MRLLFVEDDPELQSIISKRLKETGYQVDVCSDGKEGYDYATSQTYDCIILDIMLPKMSGLEVLRTLRKEKNQSYVILLTAMDAVEDRVAGLNAGADDYLVKPFAFEELLARIRTLFRRQNEQVDNLLTYQDISMNVEEHWVTRGSERIELTTKEYALLEYLLHNPGRVLTRTQISDHVWNNEFEYDSNIVDVYIRYLRNKIDKPFEVKLIQTVRGVGYALRVDEIK